MVVVSTFSVVVTYAIVGVGVVIINNQLNSRNGGCNDIAPIDTITVIVVFVVTNSDVCCDHQST